MTTTEYPKSEIQAVKDGMQEGGMFEFLFTDRFVCDEKDTALMTVTKDDLIAGGISPLHADIFLCAVAASARGDWRTTDLALYWELKD
jgi:hypothetical protein